MAITSRELMHFVEKDKIENIYLFCGTEIGEKKEIIHLLEKKIFIEEEPITYTYFWDANFNSQDFFDNLKSSLLFSSKKIIYLKNVENIGSETVELLEKYVIPYRIDKKKETWLTEKLKQNQLTKFFSFYEMDNNGYKLRSNIKAKEKKQLIELIHEVGYKNYNEDTYLVMISDSNDKIAGRLLDLLTKNQYIIFWEMFDSQKKEWIRSKFKNHNLYIDDDAINFLLDMIPNNKYDLELEINRIVVLYDAVYSAEKKRVINFSFLDEFIFHSKAENPFNLYSAILNRNLSKALLLLESLFLEDEFGLYNGLVWSHRRFMKALDLYENQNMLPADIFNQLHITVNKNKEDFLSGFKEYNFYFITMISYYLSELDYYLKVMPDDLKLVKLQVFTINFINKKANKLSILDEKLKIFL